MNKIKDLIFRYLLIFLIALPNLYVFYLIFTPLTLYSIYFLLSIFYNVTLIQDTLILNGFSIALIKACIAGSAYYLLFILSFSIPNIKLKKRIKILFFGYFLFFIANCFRIFLLILVLFYRPFLFDFTHKFFWYFISTLLVVFIWFIEIKLFKIKQIPIYSDIKHLIKIIKKSKTSKENK